MSEAKMKTPELLERLRAEAPKKETEPTDQELRQKYLDALNALYLQLKRLTEESCDEGEAHWDEDSRQIDEPDLGVYTVPTLDLVLHGRRVRWRPLGRIIVGPQRRPVDRWVVGAKGRVDMVCGARERTLAREDGDQLGWSWVYLDDGDWQHLPLNGESLWRMLNEVVK